MTTETKSKWTLIAGDGTSRPLDPKKFTELKTEFEQIATDAGRTVNDRRALAEDIRFNRWAGQSLDGKKRDDAMADGKKAFPFDGASDARVRTADDIINEQVIVMMAALMRMNLNAKPTEGMDAEISANIDVLWNWILKNQLGAEWITEWTKIAQWRQGDSPGVGYMQAWWHQADALKPTTITPADVAKRVLEEMVKQGQPPTPEEGADMQDLMANPAREDELAGLVRALWPKLTESRSLKVARELQADETSTFAYPYTCENRFRLKARRLMQDIFVPENTPTDLQRARVVFVREWFTEPELREMDARGEFNAGFLDEVLKHEGESGWKHFCHTDISGDYSESIVQRTSDKTRQRGQFELVTAFFRASNDLGIPGVYAVQFHAAVEKPGTDCELFDKRNKYPFFPSLREILTDSQWDSRGIAELSSTDQQSLKLLHDAFMDHAQLTTVPPVKVPASRPKMALVFKPLGQIKEVRPGEISWMQPPQFPSTNVQVQEAIDKRVARYFGQMVATNTPDWVRLYQQSLIDFFLITVVEVVRYGLELAWEYLDDETLTRVLGVQIQRNPDDDVLTFDVQLGFEAGMLTLEYVKEVGEMISNFVLPWDTLSTVQRDRLVRWFLSALSPTLAQSLLVPAQQAQESEIKDEQNNFTLIAAGVEPPMMTAGQNFQLRLQTLLGIGEKNPEAFQKLTEKSREILEARIKHLQGQVEQEQNAQIGRQMARPALQPAPGAAPAAAVGAN
jgi:hypothetical protein